MLLTARIIGKEIKGQNGKNFTVYSALTAHENWYRISKATPADLQKVDGKVVTLDVSRRFDRKVTIDGETREYPALVVEAILEPTIEDFNEFNALVDKRNAETLQGIK